MLLFFHRPGYITHLLCGLTNPIIVRTFGIYQRPKGLSIVMEYVDGVNLDDALDHESCSLGWRNRLGIAQSVASALLSLHTGGVKRSLYHGNLKPGHILLTKLKQVKLVSFSLLPLLDLHLLAYFRYPSIYLESYNRRPKSVYDAPELFELEPSLYSKMFIAPAHWDMYRCVLR